MTVITYEFVVLSGNKEGYNAKIKYCELAHNFNISTYFQ